MATPFSLLPSAQGLYDPRHEKDACGLAMVATLRGTAGHDIIDAALEALRHLEHRGAVGSDAGTGDGAGIITQVPDAFLRAVAGVELPGAGRYAVGNAFLPTDEDVRAEVKAAVEAIAAEQDLVVLGWREVPVRPGELGNLARAAMPVIEQLYVRALTRRPEPTELAEWEPLLASASNKTQTMQDLLWTLLNSREFAFNH